MALSRLGPSATVVAWVERTCAEQGLPVKVTDEATLARVATLFRDQTRQTISRRSGSKRLRPGTAGRIVTRSTSEATIAR